MAELGGPERQGEKPRGWLPADGTRQITRYQDGTDVRRAWEVAQS
jgi:hypothetical protein